MPAPTPEKRPLTREHHGIARVDEYAWMLDLSRESGEVLDHLRAENAHTDELLDHTKALQDEIFEEIKTRTQETDLSVPRRRGGFWYFARTEEGRQYPTYCRVPAGEETTPPDPDDPALRARQEVLLDCNVEAGDGEYFALGVYDLSVDHGTLAWASDIDGSEKYRLRFRELLTGRDLPDEIPDVYYGSCWAPDGRSFFYTKADEAWRPHEVWRHVLGTDVADDVLVHREEDERFRLGIDRTGDDAWFLLVMQSAITSEIRVASTAADELAWTTIVPRRQGIEASLDHCEFVPGGVDIAGDSCFLIATNDDAFDFRVVAAPTDGSGPESWRDVLPHRPGVRVESIEIAAGSIVVAERTQATTQIRVIGAAGGDGVVIEQPESVGTVSPHGHPERNWPMYRYEYTSMVTPSTVMELDLRDGSTHVRKVQPVLGGYDPSDYVTTRLWATAPDGTEVPVSYVERRDRVSPGPTILYGYGSYEISVDPSFSITRLSLLDRGYGFAIAHIRGGGEMGRRWYENGKLEHKQNTFSDFVAVARMLVADGIATNRGVVAWGGSAGGLLVGAALNLAPDAFGAAVAAVPFVDALNTILDPTLPLTIPEWEEWGNPIESAEIYRVMQSYAPYENIAAVEYPPILATAGLSDPRVGYWEPAKWIARLRDRATGGPFLLRTEMGAGHGGRSGRYDAWREVAEEHAFVIDQVGEGTFHSGGDPST